MQCMQSQGKTIKRNSISLPGGYCSHVHSNNKVTLSQSGKMLTLDVRKNIIKLPLQGTKTK